MGVLNEKRCNYKLGIYESGSIFRIRIYNLNNILFEKIYNKVMTDEEKK